MSSLALKFFSAALVLAIAPALHAQTSDSADEILAIGLKTLQQIDSGQFDRLWEDSSSVTKAQMNTETFATDVRNSRNKFGSVENRQWAGVIRVSYAQGSTMPPPGQYANANFRTKLNNGTYVFEKVSLRLEPQGWKVLGYVSSPTN